MFIIYIRVKWSILMGDETVGDSFKNGCGRRRVAVWPAVPITNEMHIERSCEMPPIPTSAIRQPGQVAQLANQHYKNLPLSCQLGAPYTR